jgi:hypothetical protein
MVDVGKYAKSICCTSEIELKEPMKYLVFLLLSSCSLFHARQEFEMEKLSEDVLSNKNKEGISITITPIPQKP